MDISHVFKISKWFLFIMGMMVDVTLYASSSGEDLRNKWVILDQGQVKPVLNQQNHTIINFHITALHEWDSLRIGHHQPIDIWVDNQLVFRKLPGDITNLSIPQLTGSSGADSILITIRKEKYDQITTMIDPSKGLAPGKEETIVPRETNQLATFYLIAMIAFLIILALFKNTFPARYGKLMHNPFTSRSYADPEAYSSSFLGIENLAMTLLYSFCGGIQIIYINSVLHFWPFLATWNNLFYMWLFVSSIIFSFLLVKYLMAVMVSKLMDFRKLPDVQLQDFVQVLILLSMLCLVFLFSDNYFFNGNAEILVRITHVLNVIVLLGFQFWIYFKLVKFYSYRKLMIISYLCTTEFLPVFLIMYWLLK